MAVGIRSIATQDYVLGSTYSTTVTVAVGEAPAIVGIVLGCMYGMNASATVGGVTTPYVKTQTKGQLLLSHIISAAGTYTISISGMSGTYSHTSLIFLVTGTEGRNPTSEIDRDVYTGSETLDYSLLSGQLLVEACTSETNLCTSSSGQTTLVSVSGHQVVGKVVYKQNVGTGTVSTTWTWKNNTAFVGLEFLPSGKTFNVLPMTIG